MDRRNMNINYEPDNYEEGEYDENYYQDDEEYQQYQQYQELQAQYQDIDPEQEGEDQENHTAFYEGENIQEGEENYEGQEGHDVPYINNDGEQYAYDEELPVANEERNITNELQGSQESANNLQQSQGSTQEEPIYIMTLEVDQGKSESIKIYSNSNPYELAFNFCKQYNLEFNALNYLSTEIEKLILKYNNNRKANLPGEENSNNNYQTLSNHTEEPIMELEDEQLLTEKDLRKSTDQENYSPVKNFKEADLMLITERQQVKENNQNEYHEHNDQDVDENRINFDGEQMVLPEVNNHPSNYEEDEEEIGEHVQITTSNQQEVNGTSYDPIQEDDLILVEEEIHKVKNAKPAFKQVEYKEEYQEEVGYTEENENIQGNHEEEYRDDTENIHDQEERQEEYYDQEEQNEFEQQENSDQGENMTNQHLLENEDEEIINQQEEEIPERNSIEENKQSINVQEDSHLIPENSQYEVENQHEEDLNANEIKFSNRFSFNPNHIQNPNHNSNLERTIKNKPQPHQNISNLSNQNKFLLSNSANKSLVKSSSQVSNLTTLHKPKTSSIHERLFQEAEIKRKLPKGRHVHSSDIREAFKVSHTHNPPVMIQPSKKSNVNYGEFLYYRGKMIIEEKKRHIAHKKSEMDQKNAENFTFKPKISEYNSLNLHRENMYSYNNIDYHRHKEELKRSIRNDIAETEPNFNSKISESVINHHGKENNAASSTFMKNIIDRENQSQRKLQRLERLHTEINSQFTFKPSINNKYQFDSNFYERQQIYQENMNKHKKEKEDESLRPVDEQGNPLFKPRLISSSKNFQRNTLAIQGDKYIPKDVFTTNYEFANRYKQNKESLMSKYQSSEVRVSTSNESEMIYEKVKDGAFRNLFRELDSDQDNLITSHCMSLRTLPFAIKRIIEPILQELREENETLNEDEFIRAMDHLLQTLNYEDKKTLIQMYRTSNYLNLKKLEGDGKREQDYNYKVKIGKFLIYLLYFLA
jgi:hypothetical protein